MFVVLLSGTLSRRFLGGPPFAVNWRHCCNNLFAGCHLNFFAATRLADSGISHYRREQQPVRADGLETDLWFTSCQSTCFGSYT